MIYDLIKISIFALVAVAIIQLINLSFTNVYQSVEKSIKEPHAQAQRIYKEEVASY